MNGTRHTRRITIETERVLQLSRRVAGGAVAAWCSGCDVESHFITPRDAAAMSTVSERTIYQLIESHRLHFTEDAAGLVLICINSLLGMQNAQKILFERGLENKR